ncbi:hypothetical protein [Micromonospora sp. NPDC049679]|uniref:hypothetical protein n=1 Tax=Micromonospora sp. NPDC049679 TaxID=3155920 RepID=UPI0034014782
MGLRDHTRTWNFDVHASPDACMEAFAAGLTCRTILRLGGNWTVSHGSPLGGLPQAVGVYQGRAGVASAMTVLSGKATDEQTMALGSKLTFRVVGHDADTGRTKCAMVMTEVWKVYVVFTPDARFFRGSMNQVLSKLRRIDPELQLVKT